VHQPIGEVGSFDLLGSQLFAGGSTVRVVDLSDAAVPEVIATIDPPGANTGVVVDGDLAYVTAAAEGLQIYDIACLEL
jgi:hypothetical protein